MQQQFKIYCNSNGERFTSIAKYPNTKYNLKNLIARYLLQ